jgi:DNA polymerase delta subunit 1
MRKRDPGSAPTLGDRVAYVIVKTTKGELTYNNTRYTGLDFLLLGAPAYEKSEDPIFVLEHNLPIDTTYYLENQLSKPLMRLFEPIIKSPEELLAGEHTRTVYVSTPNLGALRKFVVKTESCVGCKAPLGKGEQVVCSYCRPDIETYYYRSLANNNELEVKYSRLWTQCQRCQGSIHQDILCTSRDCPIFYMRKKVQKDMKDVADTIAKFNFDW